MSPILRSSLPLLAITVALALVALASFGIANQVLAVTLTDVEVTCPIDGKKFTAYEIASFYTSGQRLDGRRIIHGSPSLSPLPTCPETGFVIYKSEFTKEELESIRRLVVTDQFKAERAANTDYYVAAFIAQHLGADPYEIGYYYLVASWEAEDDARFDQESPNDSVATYRRYMELSLLKFGEYVASNNTRDRQWWAAQLLSTNLERKLGRFDAANIRLKQLPRESLEPDSLLRKSFNQIEALVNKRDQDPQKVEKD